MDFSRYSTLTLERLFAELNKRVAFGGAIVLSLSQN